MEHVFNKILLKKMGWWGVWWLQ